MAIEQIKKNNQKRGSRKSCLLTIILSSIVLFVFLCAIIWFFLAHGLSSVPDAGSPPATPTSAPSPTPTDWGGGIGGSIAGYNRHIDVKAPQEVLILCNVKGAAISYKNLATGEKASMNLEDQDRLEIFLPTGAYNFLATREGYSDAILLNQTIEKSDEALEIKLTLKKKGSAEKIPSKTP